MKKILVMAIALFVFLAPVLAAAAETPQQEAKALVEAAAAFLKANGKEATLAECNKAGGQFDKGDLYVFAYDMTATIVAHPKNPKLVGKNLMEVPDTDGKKVEAKTTFLQMAGDIVLCCGTYK